MHSNNKNQVYYSQMFKGKNEINYYSTELPLKTVIQTFDFKNTDEALFICDLTKIKEKYVTWQKYMPRVKPYYAIKCNDDDLVIKTLADLGTGFDCASRNEIKQILDIGVQPERIIFANPCKLTSHIKYARSNQVLNGTVDNEFEMYKLHKHYPQSNLIIRFRCEAEEVQCPLGEKFGCDAEQDASVLMLLAKSLQLNVTGISFHVGSGCKDFPAYDRAINIAKKLFKFGELLGYDMNLLDIGGGFPGSSDENFKVVSFSSEILKRKLLVFIYALHIPQIAAIVNKSLNRYFPDRKVNVIAEPGRFFVAAAYTLICKVHAKREVRSPNDNKLLRKMYYLNDGVYGSFNCILYDHQHVTVEHFLDKDSYLPSFKTLIWGPTCDALDKIIEDTELPDLCCGDLLAFPNMGAYTIPIASPFNGFMSPKTLYFLQNKK
uniref:ornithine decarboxylase n=1 Tax=Glossina austeni TaxID=7395 RepID=A0A1A9UZ43_GLOAU